MRHTQILVLAATAVVFVFSATPVRAAPPTDAEVRDAIADYRTRWEALFENGHADSEDVEAVRSTALDGIDLSELTPQQIAWLEDANMIVTDEARATAVERLKQFKDDQGVAGATAAVVLLALEGGVSDPQNRPDPELQLRLLRDAANHPALAEAVRSGAADGLFDAIRGLAKISVWKDAREDLVELQSLIDKDATPGLALGFEDYFTVLGYAFEEDDEDGQATIQRLRARMVEVGNAVLADIKSGESEFPEQKTQWLADSIARLDSPHAKGTFIGSRAPKLDIIWSSSEQIDSWDDLADDVVVLDFWATWCGPCVASFPNMRELVQRYEGYDVAIVGVTSPQGMVVLEDGVEDCPDDVQKELALMPRYIKEKNITWPVVFTEQEVFNKDYGVRGIPHVTVIAPDGTVRYNDLHPADPLHEKAAKIDALLAEFDRPAPPPVPEPTESDAHGDEAGD